MFNADEPGRYGSVDERSVRTPAEWVAVLDLQKMSDKLVVSVDSIQN